MALNFPPVNSADSNPTNGMIWTSPDGYQWTYDASVPGWKSIAPTGNSNIVYRGGIDLTQNPDTQYDDIVSGNQFAVTVGASPVDGTLYPGLGGENVDEGQIVMFDGNQWQYISNVPYATEDVAGIVELATEAEAIDSDNDRVVLTPERGAELVDHKVPQASVTVVGKTRYATLTEANSGIEASAALTPYSIADLIDRIASLETRQFPIGAIHWMACPKDHIPDGWLYCDGRRVYLNNEATEKPLYDKLVEWGNPWGPGPDSSTVRVPDLRGRFIRGWGDDSGRDPENTEFGGSQMDRFESHTHDVIDPGHDHTVNGFPEGSNDEDDYKNISDKGWRFPQVTNNTRDAKTNITIEEQGGKETRPKNINLTPVIKL